MNLRTRIDEQNSEPPPGRPGGYRRVRTLPAAREARAPPTLGTTTPTKTGPQ
jgi:hypothetical protein